MDASFVQRPIPCIKPRRRVEKPAPIAHPYQPQRKITMNPMPPLQPLLKQLHLSGILDSLEARNRQAIESKLAYTDFLALLIQDEIARREQRQFSGRLKKAQVLLDKTLDRFDFAYNPAVNHGQIADLATGRFIDEKVPVLIVGQTGTGKSHLAQALGHCALRLGHEVLFTTQTKLLGNLNAARATNTLDGRLRQLAKIPLLIIDDFGLRPLRSPQDEDFHDLVAERYERAATVLTSNLDFDEWSVAFPNKLLGAATLDRLRHGAYRVVIDGESYRKPRALPNDEKNAVAKASKTK
jgi:DNA replication protein DnaC